MKFGGVFWVWWFLEAFGVIVSRAIIIKIEWDWSWTFMEPLAWKEDNIQFQSLFMSFALIMDQENTKVSKLNSFYWIQWLT